MSKFRNKSLLQFGERVTDSELANEMKVLAFNRAASRLSRRNFLQYAGVAAGGAGIVGLAGCGGSSTTTVPTTPATPTATTPSVQDVLNFALNLEYLEASFYLTITTGQGLSSADMGTSPGTITGGQGQVAFTDPGVQQLAMQLAADEQAHVEFLRATMTALSLTPVDMPPLNLTALGTVSNDATFLAIARALETTGTSAYEGAVTLLISNTQALSYAAQIHDTEGQHEGALRQFCVANGVTSQAVDSMDIPPTATAIFNTSTSTGLNTSRTTSQGLQIVYATTSTGVTSGGFYTKGFNGTIVST